MNKPRRKVLTMDMYLKNITNKVIRNDWFTQRGFVWSHEQVNELIYTILTDDYIPPIILGEEKSSQQWIVDGGQRSCAFQLFRYGNYKITSKIENSLITYVVKEKDENGDFKYDENGDLIQTEVIFDIKNKTYDMLPEELKRQFNEYQVDMVIHEECDSERLSRLLKIYNNHTSMNAIQKAFTCLDKHARIVRFIVDHKFFLNFGDYTQKKKDKGDIERIITETVMCLYHMDHWSKQLSNMSKYLNQYAKEEEFSYVKSLLDRLVVVLDDKYKSIFTVKDSFIWFVAFAKFTEMNLPDIEFTHFLNAFENGLKENTIDDMKFYEADKGRGTKDKQVVLNKLHILTVLMNEFFAGIKVDPLKFIQENVNSDVTYEDILEYQDDLDILSLDVNNNTKLLDAANRSSLLAIIAYSYMIDKPIDNWFVNWFDTNNTYNIDQKENYYTMKRSFDVAAVA